jgi:hypothetical protein
MEEAQADCCQAAREEAMDERKGGRNLRLRDSAVFLICGPLPTLPPRLGVITRKSLGLTRLRGERVATLPAEWSGNSESRQRSPIKHHPRAPLRDKEQIRYLRQFKPEVGSWGRQTRREPVEYGGGLDKYEVKE